MQNFKVGDVVRYMFDDDCVGVIVNILGDSGWIIDWGSVKHKDLRYTQGWVSSGRNVTLLTQKEIDNLPEGFLTLFDKYKPLSLEEKLCKKIKELDTKWEQRMAQKKVDSLTTNLVRNVEAGTTSVSGQMDMRTASVVGTVRVPLGSIDLVRFGRSHRNSWTVNWL